MFFFFRILQSQPSTSPSTVIHPRYPRGGARNILTWVQNRNTGSADAYFTAKSPWVPGFLKNTFSSKKKKTRLREEIVLKLFAPFLSCFLLDKLHLTKDDFAANTEIMPSDESSAIDGCCMLPLSQRQHNPWNTFHPGWLIFRDLYNGWVYVIPIGVV